MRLKGQLLALAAIALATLFSTNSTCANDSFGSGSFGSGGSWGSGLLGGSRGGPVRNFLANAPVRTVLGRVGGRLSSLGSNGSRGGSFGGGSRGWGSSGGWGSRGRGYANAGSRGNGSWGSTAVSYGSSGGSWGSRYSGYSSHGSGYSNYANTIYSNAPGYAAPGMVGGTNYVPTDSTIISGADGTIINQGQYYEPANNVIVPEETGADVATPPSGNGLQPSPSPDGGGLEPPTEGEPTPGPDDDVTFLNRQLLDSRIDVALPPNAKIFVNGRLTTSTGATRNFVSRNQKPGQVYRYQIKAVHNGSEQVKDFALLAGGSKNIEFDFKAQTVVALTLPENAYVELAGNAIESNGKSQREFKTSTLNEGETWPDYTVKVSLEINGKVETQERMIDIVGGQHYALTFDFDQVNSNSVAAK